MYCVLLMTHLDQPLLELAASSRPSVPSASAPCQASAEPLWPSIASLPMSYDLLSVSDSELCTASASAWVGTGAASCTCEGRAAVAPTLTLLLPELLSC